MSPWLVLCPYFMLCSSSSFCRWLQEHSKGCESGPRLPGGRVPLQPGPGPASLPSPPHRPVRHLWHPPLGRQQRCQLPAVERAPDTEDTGHAEEGEGHLPVRRAAVNHTAQPGLRGQPTGPHLDKPEPKRRRRPQTTVCRCSPPVLGGEIFSDVIHSLSNAP